MLPVRAVSVSAFVPVLRMVTGAVVALTVVLVGVPLLPYVEKSVSVPLTPNGRYALRFAVIEVGYSRN